MLNRVNCHQITYADYLWTTGQTIRMRKGLAGFTLVELMAVVGIIGLLAVVGVPAIKGLTGSGGRKQALAQVLGALEVARNTAILSGTNSALIFPDSKFTYADGYAYRSMAVVQWNATNSTLPATMVGPWIVLPQGVAFFPNSISKLPSSNNISVRILNQSKEPATFQVIPFQSDGAIAQESETNGLSPATNGVSFFEGTVASGGTTPILASKMTNFETIRLFRYSGRASATLAPAP